MIAFRKWCFMICIAMVFVILGVCPGSTQEIKGPIKIITPYAPGGSSDIVARLIADKLKDILGQTVIVENKPGAGGRIGTEYAKNQPADGSSMLVMNPALFVVSPLVYSKLAYDPDLDFKPVSQVQVYHFVLSIPANSPIKDFKGLIEWLKKNPKQANYGSPASGSLPHFFGLMIGKYAGVEMVHVSYNGSGPLITALIGGHIPMGVDTYDAQSRYHPDKIRILATAGTSRKHPDIPTFKELGYEIEGVGWNGIVVPAKTPQAIMDKLSQAIVKVVKMPEVKQKLEQIGAEATGTTAEEFARVIKQDRGRWGPIIKASGFKAD
ncbi:MAG: ABC transporter substrate-binding protein [Deltaproteobacteria bacterium CG03_land_8_20_14_0_80_45_14]|nr:MAG: ABC transporter substrate-binding protein [Deltaproteobacteria bacterium CG03_land_8_20_14_0_80_45_14]